MKKIQNGKNCVLNTLHFQCFKEPTPVVVQYMYNTCTIFVRLPIVQVLYNYCTYIVVSRRMGEVEHGWQFFALDAAPRDDASGYARDTGCR